MRTTESKLLSETSMLSDRVRVRETPPGHPRLGNPPPSVVARGNRPMPGRRRAILAPTAAAPGGSDRRPRTGLRALRSRVMVRGLAAVNRQTKAAREIVKWRAELLADLGGEARLTAEVGRLGR